MISKKALRALFIALLMLFLPISAIGMAPTPCKPPVTPPGGTSVPEPSTLVLLAAAGGVIVLVNRFRKKK